MECKPSVWKCCAVEPDAEDTAESEAAATSCTCLSSLLCCSAALCCCCRWRCGCEYSSATTTACGCCMLISQRMQECYHCCCRCVSGAAAAVWRSPMRTAAAEGWPRQHAACHSATTMDHDDSTAETRVHSALLLGCCSGRLHQCSAAVAAREDAPVFCFPSVRSPSKSPYFALVWDVRAERGRTITKRFYLEISSQSSYSLD